ncbi:uncharacterized protein LOC132757452 isoform X2 [Ruditapes philippinarum]|uniref:uncharacterized protein LOC132757452 isoform X2 n=1 Tax=Ruditapes philippinarum TaxID=129788 RepID=UPI00295AE9B4|nr:uncharacterized protein LOC132757452 isoform X2 [Ruditapes philippinarum]
MIEAVYILLFVLVITPAEGHSTFQQSIPNGEIVPHPCKPNFLWRGVGHENINGGGNRNPFGLDFEKNGKVWNKSLCELDSDGDGKTNGHELGDPECIWTPKQKPAISTGLSHPGICEPVGSEQCVGKSDDIDCEQGEFKCPAVEDTDDKDNGRTSPYKCGMVPSSLCIDMIAVWSLGMSGHCMHKDCGISVGGNNGFKWAALQIHWNNPELVSGLTDSSGMVFYLTSKLRPYNAGILNIGQTEIAIPPGKEEHTERGTCDTTCTKQIMTDKITVVSVYNHMHYLGKSQTTELVIGSGAGSRVVSLGNDEIYNYDDPILHEFVDGVIVSPGDELKTTCVYKSTSRHNMTYFGDDTDDEMCFSFLTYFPAENSHTSCLSVGQRAQCAAKDGDTCDRSRLDPQNPELLIMMVNIQKFCTPGLCRNECMVYVREMQKDPCFEELTLDLRPHLIRIKDFDYHLNVIFAALDSCNTELLMEKMAKHVCKNGWLDMSHAADRKWQHVVYLEITFISLILLL